MQISTEQVVKEFVSRVTSAFEVARHYQCQHRWSDAWSEVAYIEAEIKNLGHEIEVREAAAMMASAKPSPVDKHAAAGANG